MIRILLSVMLLFGGCIAEGGWSATFGSPFIVKFEVLPNEKGERKARTSFDPEGANILDAFWSQRHQESLDKTRAENIELKARIAELEFIAAHEE